MTLPTNARPEGGDVGGPVELVPRRWLHPHRPGGGAAAARGHHGARGEDGRGRGAAIMLTVHPVSQTIYRLFYKYLQIHIIRYHYIPTFRY